MASLGPEWLVLAVIAPFVGSFLGVLVARLPAGRPVFLARSACAACHAPLGARDLVPIFSWLARRGRCRHCGATIGLFAPGIEIAAVLVVAWAASQTSGWLLWESCILGWALLVLAAIDWRHFVLPDIVTWPLVAAGLLVAVAIEPALLPHHAIGAAVGFAAFAALAWGYRKLRGREGLGMGDAKLLAGAGAWVSWAGLGSVVLIAAASGLAVALARGPLGHPPRPGDRVAFGPYLCLGLWITWLHGPIMLG